jgi:hypothetical protein
MIFGESSFLGLPGAAPARRGVTRSRCPHCHKSISIPIDRLGSSGATGKPHRDLIEAKSQSPALLAFE